jgi:hypothetical protein
MWSDSPGVISIEADGRLLPHRSGSARIMARSGGRSLEVRVSASSAASRVEVARSDRGPDVSLTVHPDRPALRLGEVRGFQALAASGPMPADWSSSNEQKVAHLQDHLFQGLEPGQAQVCARANGRRACTTVEVTP